MAFLKVFGEVPRIPRSKHHERPRYLPEFARLDIEAEEGFFFSSQPGQNQAGQVKQREMLLKNGCVNSQRVSK